MNLPNKKFPVIQEGWVGKPKGSLQLLYERGYIEEADGWNWYAVNGKKDIFGNIDKSTSLKMLMSIQPDFMEQETLLMFYGKQMGVTVDRTPKCHPELAGEGIEYAWGAAKLWYRWQHHRRWTSALSISAWTTRGSRFALFKF